MGDYKHESMWKCLKMQWFLNGKQVAVFSHNMGDDEEYPTYALYSPRQFKKAQKADPELVADHTDRIRKHSIPRMLYWTWREYVHGWKLQLSKELDCGCREWRGKKYGLYCGTDHMMEAFGGRG